MLTLIKEETLLQEIEKKAHHLNSYFECEIKPEYPVAVLCVLDGAIWFAGQILTKLKFPLYLGSVVYKRYSGEVGTSSAIYSPPSLDVHGLDVLLLDDIYDEGVTLEKLKEICLARGAKSVTTCVLLNKRICRPKKNEPDFWVTTIGGQFVFGSGMDVDGLHRNEPGIKVNSK